MKALWRMWPGIIPAETCAQIIEKAMKLPPQQAVIGANAYHPETRESELRWIYYENRDFPDLFETARRHFERANAEAFGVDASYIPSFQFTTYHAARLGHYRWHTDVFWESDNACDRKLSMVMQLSPEHAYKGGELELDVHSPPPAGELRRQGTVIVFPSFVHHRVMPVTDGTRHSLVAWQEGPRWR
jgi:PKHD-type hydroxylase